jgi:hypothetical protein
MITVDEFKKLAADTGLMFWENEALFYKRETTYYLSYPMPMFRENCEDDEDYKMKSAVISLASYKDPPEIYIYGNILYDFDHLDKLVEGKEIYCYNMISALEYDDGLQWNNKTYEEIRDEVLKVKKMIFDKQQEINLEKIKGDF